jgi:hypothetical protein
VILFVLVRIDKEGVDLLSRTREPANQSVRVRLQSIQSLFSSFDAASSPLPVRNESDEQKEREIDLSLSI